MYDILYLNNKKVGELKEIAEKLNLTKFDKLKKITSFSLNKTFDNFKDKIKKAEIERKKTLEKEKVKEAKKEKLKQIRQKAEETKKAKAEQLQKIKDEVVRFKKNQLLQKFSSSHFQKLKNNTLISVIK